MNVLSLFDGMSCGQIALNKLGFEIDNYYASEIDKHAMSVTKYNYPNTKHIGDVTKVKGVDLPEIDLLIGGSPCQGFSTAGKGLNFNDPRSKLFFEYVRLLEECKPKYFLLENVSMKKEHLDVISKHLGVEPILINSELVSGQSRKRYYWTNIPNIKQPDNKNIFFKSILEPTRKPLDQSRIDYSLTAKYNQDRPIQVKDKSITLTCTIGQRTFIDNNQYFRLTPKECERLQTVPDDYTEFGLNDKGETVSISNNQRYQMLGNGWTVDVIAHIFKNIPKI